MAEGRAYAGCTQGAALQTAKPPNREGRRLCADYRTGLGGELQPCVPLMRRKGTKAPGRPEKHKPCAIGLKRPFCGSGTDW
jgi:hypothetical protein